MGKIKEKIDATQHEYEKEHDWFIKEISKREQRLDDIRRKRKHYEEIGIKTILELDAQESKLLSEKGQKEKLLHALEEQYKDVTDKYRTLYATLDDEWSKFELALKEELQRCRDRIQTERDKCVKIRDQRKKSVEDAYSEWLSASDERLTTLQGNHNLSDKRLSELQYWHPMEKETSGFQEDIRIKMCCNRLRSQCLPIHLPLSEDILCKPVCPVLSHQ